MRRTGGRRGVVRAAAVAALLLACPVPAAWGAEEWCEIDPLVVVKTPQGALVPLFVTTGAPDARYLAHVTAAVISYRAEPAARGQGTRVRVEVRVPDSVSDAAGYVAPAVGGLLGEAQTKEGGSAESQSAELTLEGRLVRRADFPARSTVSSGPLRSGTVFAEVEGRSGRAIVLDFTLDVP